MNGGYKKYVEKFWIHLTNQLNSQVIKEHTSDMN